ncbi:nucleotidyltransferase family protein [soil metagenome]
MAWRYDQLMPASRMPSSRLPVVIVLAAGRGERFRASGGASHKLDAMLAGKPVLQHVLDAVTESGLACHVVTADASRPGMGDSIAAGVRATADAPGWLIVPGDLPLVRSSTLLAVSHALALHEVVIPVFEARRGHPVGFARVCGEALQKLAGPQGAASVVRQHEVFELQVKDEGTVTDVDTVEDLARAAARLGRRLRQ